MVVNQTKTKALVVEVVVAQEVLESASNVAKKIIWQKNVQHPIENT